MMASVRPLLLAGSVELLLHCAGAAAVLPEYGQIELQARSNLIVNDNGWNVPPGTSFNSISAAINDAQQVSFTAGIVPIDGDLSNTGAGLWLGGHASGAFVAVHDPGTDPKATMIISDRPSINADGQVVYYTSLDGGTYAQTLGSGTPSYGMQGSSIAAGMVEMSNTDIAEEFSKMIVTQQAYSANTRVITTAQKMLEDVINVIR